jgi:hypothetical protein
MTKIIINPLDFYKIEYIIKSMKTLKGGEAMAKVRLEGAVRAEFEVKYGLNEDLVIKVHAVPVGDGKYALVGEGNIANIPQRTLDFIGDRIESLLKKDKSLIGLDGFGKFFKYSTFVEIQEDRELHKAMYQTELGTLIMRAYKWRKPEALEEVLERNLFPLSRSGMREFAGIVKVKEKAGCLDPAYMKVKEIL